MTLSQGAADWRVSWAASTCGTTGTLSPPDATFRQTLRLSLGGDAVRLRFAHPHGYSPLIFDHVTVAIASLGASSEGTPQPVRVDGSDRILVQPGTLVTSDPVPLTTYDLATLSVSLHVVVPMEISEHDWANRPAWSTLAAIGDRTSDSSGAAFRPWGTSWAWLDAVDVRGADASGSVVVVGDSITDGAGSDYGTDTRWTDVLAERFATLPPADPRRRSVANAGVGGNMLAGPGDNLVGMNALSRLDRDALSLAGVTEVVVFVGSNDLHGGVRAVDVLPRYAEARDRIRAAGCRALIATIVPRVGGFLWTQAHECERAVVNDWIRGDAGYDAVLDFAAVLDDAASPGRLRPEFDADGTHPNTRGYRALADSVDLDLFR